MKRTRICWRPINLTVNDRIFNSENSLYADEVHLDYISATHGKKVDYHEGSWPPVKVLVTVEDVEE